MIEFIGFTLFAIVLFYAIGVFEEKQHGRRD